MTESTAAEATQEAADIEPQPATSREPKIEGDFDADRAASLIGKLRSEIESLKPLAAKARELEDASKTEIEKATERLTAAEQRAQEAELRALRLEVAADKGLTPAQARRLVGATREELEADADELLETFASKAPARLPVEKLKPGAAPAGEPEETDPRKLALAARARGRY